MRILRYRSKWVIWILEAKRKQEWLGILKKWTLHSVAIRIKRKHEKGRFLPFRGGAQAKIRYAIVLPISMLFWLSDRWESMQKEENLHSHDVSCMIVDCTDNEFWECHERIVISAVCVVHFREGNRNFGKQYSMNIVLRKRERSTKSISACFIPYWRMRETQPILHFKLEKKFRIPVWGLVLFVLHFKRIKVSDSNYGYSLFIVVAKADVWRIDLHLLHSPFADEWSSTDSHSETFPNSFSSEKLMPLKVPEMFLFSALISIPPHYYPRYCP